MGFEENRGKTLELALNAFEYPDVVCTIMALFSMMIEGLQI